MNEEKPVEGSPGQEYVPIRTATLRPSIQLGFDVFVSVGSKHILYIKKVDHIGIQQLKRLHEKNARILYILKEDFPAYQEFLQDSTDQALDKKETPLPVKADIINGQSKAAVEEIFQDPNSREAFAMAQMAALNQYELIRELPDAVRSMLAVSSADRTTYQHSVNVSTIALGIAVLLRAPKPVCEIIALGGLLHDIGAKDHPDMFGRMVDQMSPEEKEIYTQHPRTGASILAEKPYISRDVLDIIVLHEERLDGKGFPGGLTQIDQVLQIVGLANLYDRQVTFFKMSPRQSFDAILAMRPYPYDDRLLKALKDVLVANRLY